MKRVWPYILSVSLFVYLIIVFTFVSAKLREVKCEELQVVVDATEENAFVDETDIVEMIKRGYGDLKGREIVTIDKDSIERLLVKNAVIKSAQVYYSLDGSFHVEIMQRKPVLRIMAGGGYYVDEEGKIMPLSRRYSPRVMVATGNVSKKFACDGLYPFVKTLQRDELWNALIEQIVVEKGNEVVLIPKVGNFRIVLGTLENVDEKLENLRLFLQEGIVLKGWNVYKEINLKFKNQVVCVKR